MSVVILTISTILQFLAAFIAIRLNDITGKKIAWIFIAIAMSLMGIRSSITLYSYYIGSQYPPAHHTAEMVALMISLCMVLAMILIIPMFKNNQKINKALESSEKRYRTLFERSADAILIIEDNKFIDCNLATVKMLGYKNKKELLDTHPSELSPEEQADGSLSFEKANEMMKIAIEHGSHRFEWNHKRQNGEVFPVEVLLTSIPEDERKIIHVVWRDITERKEASDLITYQATHDKLTGLLNRYEFEHRLERILSTTIHDSSEHALCYLDLDQFKVVNDTCGHVAGDELLRQLGNLLSLTVRQRDTLARLGGDEFGILMEQCPLDAAQRVAEKILKSIQQFHFVWEEQSFKVGASIGLVPVTKFKTNFTELLKDADAACYMAKDKGRNRIHVVNSDDVDIAQRLGEMQWVTRIQQSIEENRFCLYAQSIVPLAGNTEKHYEILVRMICVSGETIPPGAFLAAAERYDMGAAIDCWVIENTLKQLASHPLFLERINFCAINLSGQSLTDQVVLDFIIKQLKQSGIPGNKICFEITETAAISVLSLAEKFITTLKKLGCRFALDDFGSGLSSFAYLKNLSVDFLKIDGMFVKDMVDDEIDHAMVKSINEIGQVMGMKTIAEFVENDEIKGMLREIGVNYAQGYGVEKPQPFDDIIENIVIKKE